MLPGLNSLTAPDQLPSRSAVTPWCRITESSNVTIMARS